MAVSVRPWVAIDVDAEQRADRARCRPVRWQEKLYRWLVEFNKY